MKRYKVQYWIEDRTKSFCLAEISKSGRLIGVRICFSGDERKYKQNKYKKDLLNGVYKTWWSNSKSWFFINWKKHKEQGVQIKFK